MDTRQADEFTEQEDMILHDLKLNCKNDGREINPNISASIFHKLGTLYLQRSERCSTTERMICLIRCAALLNAALVRTGGNAHVIKQDLMQLDLHVVKSAKAEQKDANLCEKAKKIKLLVEKMRKHVDKKLCEIPKVEAHESKRKMYFQELNKVEAIERLQNQITKDYTNIMANLAKKCRKIMGKAPCKFTILGMGSLARKEITPYSDFEHVIVLGSKFDGQNEEILNYFRWYSVIFQIILIHLGETIIPSILNNTNSNLGSWFYDEITKSGVSFDGTFPWACKYPLGRQQLIKDKNWKTELIKSVPDMLEYLNHEESIKNGYHLSDILTKVCYVYGNQRLFKQFKSGLNDILQKQNENIKNEVLQQIINDLENFSIRSVLLKISDEGNYHVKKDVYRVTTLFIAALGRLNKIVAFSCFDVIRQLAKTHKISYYTKHNLMYAIAIACEIRLRWYMVNKSQKDNINGTNATSKFLDIIGETSAFRYFQIAYALQCDISKRFHLKKGHFYSHPHLLNISIYSSFQSGKLVEHSINAFEVNPREQCLLDFNTCLIMLTTKQTKVTHKQSQMATGTKHEKDLYEKFYLMGQRLLDMNKPIDAKDYFERALKIIQQISSDVATDRDIANTMHEIGRCLVEMNKLTDAKDYLEKALEIKQRISIDIATDIDVALSLHYIGQCLFGMNNFFDAKDYLESALKIKQRISRNVATDRNIAVTLQVIGQSLMEMKKFTDAKSYLERALKIYLRISSDDATDRDVANSLEDIGQCLIEEDQLTMAKDYLKRALKIKQKISSDVSNDKDVAIALHTIGRCLFRMNELIDAKHYLEKSLEIKKRISSDVGTDRSVAISLHDIGQCLLEMDKFSDAKDYFEKALQIKQQISSDIGSDRHVAITLHEIGQCLIRMNKFTEANKYLEKSRKLNNKQRCY